MNAQDLHAKLTQYFTEFRTFHPEAQVIFTGCSPYYADAKAYAEQHGLTFTDCGCCSNCSHQAEREFSAFGFEKDIMCRVKPSLMIPVLQQVTRELGCYVRFHTELTRLDADSYEQHSVVFAPAPEGWIDDMYHETIKGKLMFAAPDHGVYRRSFVPYSGIYLRVAHDYMLGRLPKGLSKAAVAEAKFDAEWLMDYRQTLGKDLCLKFGYEYSWGIEMGCENCTVVLEEGGVSFECGCPVLRFDEVDDELAECTHS